MAKFVKSSNITGKYKALAIVGSEITDAETGEIVDIVSQLYSVYGDAPFSLSTSNKVDVELEVGE